MATKTVFYSFHYKRDVNRVQLVRNLNVLDGQPLLGAQEWESKLNAGRKAIENWIAQEMRYKRVVVVLIGQETAGREWVQYEIAKAWEERKPIVGIRIHGLSDFGTTDKPGSSPFDSFVGGWQIPVFDPTVTDWLGKIDSKATYSELAQNLERWVGLAKARP